MMYHYKALVTRVVDGDTVDVNIDLGFNLVHMKQRIRLFGVDAPELKGADKLDGLSAKSWLQAQIENKEIDLISLEHKKGKYGRWLGIICMDGRNINQELIEKGFAVSIAT